MDCQRARFRRGCGVYFDRPTNATRRLDRCAVPRLGVAQPGLEEPAKAVARGESQATLHATDDEGTPLKRPALKRPAGVVRRLKLFEAEGTPKLQKKKTASAGTRGDAGSGGDAAAGGGGEVEGGDGADAEAKGKLAPMKRPAANKQFVSAKKRPAAAAKKAGEETEDMKVIAAGDWQAT